MESSEKRSKSRIIIVMFVLGLLGLVYAITPIRRNLDEYPPEPPYITAKNCPEILLQLDDAISVWAIAKNQTTTNRPTSDILSSYFKEGKTPVCPQGGNIILGTRTLATKCSVHGMANDKRPAPRSKKHGLLESLLPFLYPRTYHSGNACIANLKQMDGAAQQWALENKKTDSDTIDVPAAAKYLKGGQLPLCPANGKYQFTTVSNPPTCTKATILGHSLP